MLLLNTLLMLLLLLVLVLLPLVGVSRTRLESVVIIARIIRYVSSLSLDTG